MQLVIQLSARRDLEDIQNFYRPLNPLAAQKIALRINQTLLNLLYFPRSGAIIYKDIRSFYVSRTKYRIIYQIKEDTLIILRIWQAEQHPPSSWKENL